MDLIDSNTPSQDSESNVTSAPTSPQTDLATKPRPATPRLLPPWKVLLHNDDVNDQEHVVAAILALTNLKPAEAVRCMKEAHQTGVGLVLNTHRERAELYVTQFQRRDLTVTIEPAR
jgi:ATP-dependent Clp protease adaptor protein ClpS